jgi:hypothetical protein
MSENQQDLQYGSLPPARPRWFIDVSNLCLVPVSTSFKLEYVALSYVWGGTKTLQTVLSTVEKFQTQDAFRVGEYGSQIPATIRDAMHVTSLLGEVRYKVQSPRQNLTAFTIESPHAHRVSHNKYHLCGARCASLLYTILISK